MGEELGDNSYSLLWAKSESTLTQYRTIIDLIKRSIALPNIEEMEKLNSILHSYLISLLISSFIGEQNRTKVTPHFYKIKRFYSYQLNKLYPSKDYLFNLSNQYIYTWGGSFGTLSYYIHLSGLLNEYLTPSQLIDICVKQAYSYNSYSYISNTTKPFISNDNVMGIDDKVIYSYPIYILNHPDISTSIELISNIKPILKKILDWYLSPYTSKSITKPPLSPPLNSNEYYAYDALCRIAKVLLGKGLTQFKDLSSYRYIHNDVPSIWIETIDEVLSIRDNILYDPNQSNNRLYESIYMELINTIPYKKYDSLLRRSQYILSNLYPPGGYNLVLLITASTLINKAFILSHGSSSNRDRERIMDLIYKASVCLRKSNIKSLMLIGNNLKQLSEVTKEEPINIEDIYYE